SPSGPGRPRRDRERQRHQVDAERQRPERLSVQVHERPPLAFYLNGRSAEELDSRVVHVTAAIEAGKLAYRLDAGDVANDAQVEQAVRERGVRADVHTTPVIPAVGDRDEQHPSVDLALAVGRLEREPHPSIVKTEQLAQG